MEDENENEGKAEDLELEGIDRTGWERGKAYE